MGAVIRHYAAVKDGRVVASCSTIRQYRWAVLHTTKIGVFATFHTTREGAERATLHMAAAAPDKELVEPIETKRKLPAGAPFDVTEVHDEAEVEEAAGLSEFDQDTIADEAALRQVEILEGVWRNS